MSLTYMTGFGNEHTTEAEAGALPIGRNSPQQPPLGLYAEKLSGTAFTAPKSKNARSWLYRIKPSVSHLGFEPIEHKLLASAPISGTCASPDPLRWDPFAVANNTDDFVDGLRTIAASGDASLQMGIGIHVYNAARSMIDRYFTNSDGELLIVPQQGTLDIRSEFGLLKVPPEFVVLIPRGVKFQVELPDGPSRGYICENYGAAFELPERGPIGSDGLANARDFEYPVAAYEDLPGKFELVCKMDGQLFRAGLDRSPLDVVAWHGNYAPYRYDLNRFNVMGSISFDHPDPSIFTVLTSPSETKGVANADFVVFAPRWLVTQDTFRPPWYHRNIMSEFMGLITGEYDAKTGGGFSPGGSSLHNAMVPHGPDASAFEVASSKALKPEYLADTMAFMFETRYLIRPTDFALDAKERQKGYADVWANLTSRFESPDDH